MIAFENLLTETDEPLTEMLGSGDDNLLAQTIETEVKTLLAQYVNRCDELGQQTGVLNGYRPEREVQPRRR